METIKAFLESTGIYAILEDLKDIFSLSWDTIGDSAIGSVIMVVIACFLLYLAIGKKFEPLLLIPIAFGMLMSNLPLSPVFASEGEIGLLYYFYQLCRMGILPPLIFMGIGAMTDFGPLIANPKSLLLGAAAQLGIFITFIGAIALGFTAQEASSIGIIGGANGPATILLTSILAPHRLGTVAIAAYSYMALVPVIQPPIMRALTTKEERAIEMKQLKPVGKKARILFPIMVTIVTGLIAPDAISLIGMLMLGNLFRESGLTERLSDTAQNALINIVTILLGVGVGASATAKSFLHPETLLIIFLGVVAFAGGTAGGVLFAKFMNLFTKEKINPLIGSAGVSAVPMAARVSQKVGQEENPGNFLLMHAMGPNVAGAIGSAVVAGVFLSLFRI